MVKNWKLPQDRKGVKTFLGFTSYYRSFVENYSVIAKPLTELTSEKVPFIWTGKCTEVFEKLCDQLIQSPILSLPREAQYFTLSTDASGFGIGAILEQEIDGVNKVICYGS